MTNKQIKFIITFRFTTWVNINHGFTGSRKNASVSYHHGLTRDQMYDELVNQGTVEYTTEPTQAELISVRRKLEDLYPHKDIHDLGIHATTGV